MAGKHWWALKSVLTTDYKQVNRIGHGDGGPNNVEYHEKVADILNDVLATGDVMSLTNHTYKADDNSVVTADGPGITVERSNGNVIFIIPELVNPISFRIHGTASELNNGEMSVTIRGGRGSGTDYNTDDSDARYPSMEIGLRTQILQTDPFTQAVHDSRSGGYVIENTPISNGTPGETTTTIKNLAGEWELFGQL